MDHTTKGWPLMLMLVGLIALGQAPMVAFAQRPTIVTDPTPRVGPQSGIKRGIGEPPAILIDQTPMDGGRRYSTPAIQLTDHQFVEIYNAIPAPNGPRPVGNPQTKPVLGTFVHGPKPLDPYTDPVPVLPDADDVIENPESIDQVVQAYENAVYYYEYAAICARIAQEKCMANGLVGSARYWATIADCSTRWASFSSNSLRRFKAKFADERAGSSGVRSSQMKPTSVPQQSSGLSTAEPNGGKFSPNDREFLHARIEQIDGEVDRLRKGASELQDEIAEATRDNRFSSAVALRSTLEEYRRLIAELSGEQVKIRAQLRAISP
jgi:hypothetical protein